MPLLDWNDPAAWSSTWRMRRKDGLGHWGYERGGKASIMGPSNAAGIITALGLNNTHRIAFIGAAYGWLAKDVADQCGATVIAIDTSTHIQGTKAANADIDIFDIDIGTGQGRSTVRKELNIQGNNPADYAITEDVITSLTDQENLDLSAQLHILADVVVHWTTIPTPAHFAKPGVVDMRFNWHTIEEWKSLLPNDLFILRSGDALL